MGSNFAVALFCRSSLEWNNHDTLLASRSARRKMRFAATCIIETASKERLAKKMVRKVMGAAPTVDYSSA